MTNLQIAYIFEEIANMLEIKGENIYKIRAYRKASQTIKKFPMKLEDFLEEHQAESIPGIGKTLAGKIQEIIDTGECKYYEKLKKEIPEDLVKMLRIPGLGPKRIKKLYKVLEIETIDQLEKAAKKGKLRDLPGFGVKMQQSVLRGIKMLKEGVDKVILPVALTLGEYIVSNLNTLPEVKNISLVGSVRRKKEVVEDIDILITSSFPRRVIDAFINLPEIDKVIVRSDTKASIISTLGIRVNLVIVDLKSYYSALQYFTGSKQHNLKLYSEAHKKDLILTKYNIIDKKKGVKIYPKREKELYRYVGLEYIAPELREDRGEIEAACNKKLPRLLIRENIKGDLHIHSNYSDGTSTIDELIIAAKKMGYEYIAITDHSKSLKIARGLSEEQLKSQLDYIDKINRQMNDFKVLTGIEVDILLDGSLDFSDEILKKLDIVIASIHTGFRQDKDLITQRLISACRNPYVDIIAHPTGRLLTRRPPYNADFDRLLEVAAKTGTILEINSSPQRLDLNDFLTKKAKELGIKIAINTDAHSRESLKDITYGVWVARRGWLEPRDVINVLPLKELLKTLKGGIEDR